MYRPFSPSLALLLLFSLVLGFAGPVSAQELRLEGPAFSLSGVETTFTVGGLPTDDTSARFEILVNGSVLSSGTSSAKELATLKVILPQSGTVGVELRFGEASGKTSIRCLPGWTSLLPPLLAIFLALLTREVLSSLFVGIWLGATLIHQWSPILGFLRSVDHYLLNSLADSGHASIIIFSLALGGMVGILNRTGGMQGVVQLISKIVVGPRSAQLAAWLLGVLIFFDDYANTLIVGNSMRPITDSHGVSREKLSYIVDSTAAPVAGIALLSTWIGYEIGLIRQAFIDLHIPETNFYGVFLQTIPYRFYCLLALFFGLVICLTDREFGGMWNAEMRARTEGKPLADGAHPISSPEAAMPELPAAMPKRWLNAAIPIGFVIFGTLLGLVGSGGSFAPHFDVGRMTREDGSASTLFTVDRVQADMGILTGTTANEEFTKIFIPSAFPFAETPYENIEAIQPGERLKVDLVPTTLTSWDKLRSAFADADSTKVLIWVSIAGSILALFLGWSQRLITLDEGIQAWINGTRAMILAMAVLLLAWSINGVCKDLRTADFLVEMVRGVVQPWFLPGMVFLLACFISFATGTSWGTMAILLPITIPMAYKLNLEHYQQTPALHEAWPVAIEYTKAMILVSIGAVLEGSIFGDHCSPISDTTIMSSMASGSDHIDHVKTQAPYAFAVAAAAILFCYLPAGAGYSPYLLGPLACVALVVFLFAFGRKVPHEVTVAGKS